MALQAFLWRHRREHVAVAVDLREVHPWEMAQPSLLDRLANQRALFCCGHFHGIFSASPAVLEDSSPLWQQPATGEQDSPGQPGRMAPLPRRGSNRCGWVSRAFFHQAIDDEVRTRADKGTGAAENSRVAQRDHEF